MRVVVLTCLGIGIATTLAVHGQSPGRAATAQAVPAREPFTVVETSIPDMRRAMDEGRTTSREIVQQHLVRIALYEDRLNAVIAVNPGALREAEATVDGGLLLMLGKNVQLDAGVNLGVTRAAPDVQTFFGVTLRF